MSEEFCLVNSIDRTSTRIRGSTQNQRRPPPRDHRTLLHLPVESAENKTGPTTCGQNERFANGCCYYSRECRGPRTILVCDDAPSALLVRASLEHDSDYVIEVAADGAEALVDTGLEP